MRFIEDFNTAVEENDNNAKPQWFIFFSELAYKYIDLEDPAGTNPRNIRNILDVNGDDFYHSFEVDNTQGFIIASQNNVVISFRGTEYANITGFKKDWNRNFNCILENFNPHDDDVKVHAGFLEGLNAIWQVLLNHLDVIENIQDKNIWFTGHSLGGALATLAAMRLSVQRPKLRGHITGVYTFGSPRCGNEAFKNAYHELGLDDRTFRYVNNNDLIVSAPFFLSSLAGRIPTEFLRKTYTGINGACHAVGLAVSSSHYHHVGQEFYINFHAAILNSPNSYLKRLDYALGGLTGGAILDKLLDHRHKKYFDAIRDNNPRGYLIPDLPDPLTPRTTCSIM